MHPISSRALVHSSVCEISMRKQNADIDTRYPSSGAQDVWLRREGLVEEKLNAETGRQTGVIASPELAGKQEDAHNGEHPPQ